MSGGFFFLVRMWAVGAYTSSQFLPANRFQGEHRWAQLRATMWRTPRCEGLYESAARCRRHRRAFGAARPGGPVSGMQTKESRIKEEQAQRCNWNPLGLHNVRWPSSSKQELKEPTPCPLLYLFNPESSVRLEKTEWGWEWANVKIPGICTAPKQS